jgi:hypothetical protein
VVNGPGSEGAPSISSDGLSLYFDSDASRQGGQGSGDIWVTTRLSIAAPFSPPTNLGPTVTLLAFGRLAQAIRIRSPNTTSWFAH